MRFYTLEYFRFNLQICNKAWLDYIENFVYSIKKNFENIQKCMVLKNGQQRLFVANAMGLFLQKGNAF